MMRISTKGRYALRIMIDLARYAASEPISLRDVAARQQITPKYMESIMAMLLRAGLVTSARGKSGGYRLTRPAAQYNAYEILCAAEGDLEPVQCLSSPVNTCPMRERCTTLPVWTGLSEVIRIYLEGISLADLTSSAAGEMSYCDGI